MEGEPAPAPARRVLLQPGRALGERLFEVSEGVWRIPIPTGYVVGDVNLYWVDGPDPVLIDTGVPGDAAFDLLRQALGRQERRIEDLGTLLLTHHHVDHAGNARRIREVSGCRVLVRRRAARRLSDPEGVGQASAPAILAYLQRCGFTDQTLTLFDSFLRRARKAAPPCPGLLGIDDGDVVTGAGRTIRVHARPGHSSADLVFEIEGSGILFTGDHVLPRITPNPTLEAPEPEDFTPYRPLLAYRESLEKTGAMECTLACPGHESPFTGLAIRCRRIREHQDRRIRRVHDLLRQNGPMTLKDLSLALFGRVHAFDIFLTLSEVQGALDLLEAEGQATVDRSGPVLLCSAR